MNTQININCYAPINGEICSNYYEFKDLSFYIIDNIRYDYCTNCHKKMKYKTIYHKYKNTDKYKSYIKSYECECGVTLKSGQKTNIKKHLLSQKHADNMNDNLLLNNINLDHLTI